MNRVSPGVKRRRLLYQRLYRRIQRFLRAHVAEFERYLVCLVHDVGVDDLQCHSRFSFNFRNIAFVVDKLERPQRRQRLISLEVADAQIKPRVMVGRLGVENVQQYRNRLGVEALLIKVMRLERYLDVDRCSCKFDVHGIRSREYPSF